MLAHPYTPQRSHRDGLLGTVVEVVVDSTPEIACRITSAVFDEIERLERIFNWFDPGSELRRWSRGEIAPGKELAEVAALAERWKRLSGGAFDPAAGTLVAVWDRAAGEGRLPAEFEIDQALEAMASSDRHSLNAIAKGWIVDQAAKHGLLDSPANNLVVNAGGDLLHLGTDPITVGIEDPHRPYDNIPPLLRASVSNSAIATSGGSRRGWRVNGERYSHIIDPRTGWPQSHVASATVIAPEVATADVMATVLTVVGIEEGLALCDEIEVACCIIDAAGTIHHSERWRQTEATPPGGGSAPSQEILSTR